jgi:hypothetical protein
MLNNPDSRALPCDSVGPTRAPLGANFPLHGHLPSRLGLLVGSTGVLRLPATLGDVVCERGEVAGGIQVPVEPEPAGLTGEGALGQGEFGFHPATGRARSRRGIEPVGHHQPAAVPAGFVGQLSAQFGQAGIGKRPGEPPVAHHPGHVQLLDHDDAVLGGQGGGELVEGVAAEIGGAGVDPGQSPAGLRPTLGGGRSAGELTVQPAELA